MVFLQHRERLSGLREIWYELENKVNPRSQWKVKHEILFPSSDTEEVGEEAGEEGTRNCLAWLGVCDCCTSESSAFWSPQGLGTGPVSTQVLPACPHFPQPSSLIVHSVVFHPLRVKFRGVVTLCDISCSWVSLHPALRSEVHTGRVLTPVETASFAHKTQGNHVSKEGTLFSIFDLGH